MNRGAADHKINKISYQHHNKRKGGALKLSKSGIKLHTHGWLEVPTAILGEDAKDGSGGEMGRSGQRDAHRSNIHLKNLRLHGASRWRHPARE